MIIYFTFLKFSVRIYDQIHYNKKLVLYCILGYLLIFLMVFMIWPVVEFKHGIQIIIANLSAGAAGLSFGIYKVAESISLRLRSIMYLGLSVLLLFFMSFL